LICLMTKMSNSQLRPFDVLINITGASIGRSCVFPDKVGEANVNQHVCIIRPSDLLNPNYLSQFLNSSVGQQQIFSNQAGGNREGLNFAQLGAFQIPLPSLDEQEMIAKVLSNNSQSIEAFENYKSKLQDQKRGLTQALLTGQTRV
jgi:type I restriction enzyme, S subunit